MKPKLVDGKLTVELHVADCRALNKSRAVGELLSELHQSEGEELVNVVDAILEQFNHASGSIDN